MNNARVVLGPRRAGPFLNRHPWVFPAAILRVEGNPADGDSVEVVTSQDEFIGHGFFNSRSKLRVRLLTWNREEAIDRAWLQRRIASAIAARDRLGLNAPDQGCRLIFSEADFLSGLTVDRYGDWLSIQLTSLGMARFRDDILDILCERFVPKGIFLRTEKGVGESEGLEARDGLIWGEAPPDDFSITENGLRMFVNLREGQKTGYFLDQRDNRQPIKRFAAGRSVLDAFCYSGGFGLHALAGGATRVVGVDMSASALDLARRNAEENGLANAEWVKSDVFADLESRAARRERFGMIVLDPPKFARDRSKVGQALTGYRRLARLGIALLEPESILVLCCCSGVVAASEVEEVIAESLVQAGREGQFIGRFGQPPDHPTSTSCPETAYLKCFVVRVV